MFVFESMSLTDVNKKNFVEKSYPNLIIPWDDPYPNISATLSENKQIVLKSLTIIDAKKDFEEKKRISSSSTTRSGKQNEATAGDARDSTPSSIMKSRSSTKMSGNCCFVNEFVLFK